MTKNVIDISIVGEVTDELRSMIEKGEVEKVGNGYALTAKGKRIADLEADVNSVTG